MAIKIIVDPNKGLYQQSTDGASSFDVEAGVTLNGFGGGGGGTVIEDGANIGGVYEGNVLCLGDATFNDDVTVQGDLLVLGNLTNDIGAELIVKGNLTAQNLYFNRSDLSLAQSNITVDGNVTIKQTLNFRQGGGWQAVLRVGGNLISSFGVGGAQIDASGYNAPGAAIIVYGDMSGFVDINLNGADASGGVSEEAYVAGSMVVYGDLTMIPFGTTGISFVGGDGDTYSTGGSGGNLEVYGNFTSESCPMSLYGGDSTAYDAGNGGTFECGGNCVVNTCTINLSGGESSDGTGGNSGGFICGGNLSAENSEIRLIGGDSTDGKAGDGGSLDCGGNCVMYHIETKGGNANYGDFLTGGGNGGNGGAITVYGNLAFNDSITVNGGIGRGTGRNGGAAGNITVYGDVIGSDSAIIEGQGGQCRGNQSGNASNFNVYGNVLCYDIDFSGGTWVAGDGSSTNLIGGTGGFVNVYGNLIIKGSLTTKGGDARSVDKTGYAGNGGTVNALSLYVGEGTLDARGGTRSGATTEAHTGGAGASGGAISVSQDMHVYEFDNSGGDVTTTYKTRTGGNGGNVTVDGNLKIESLFTSNGGSSVGFNGGNAGAIYIAGSIHCIGTMYLVGGNSNDSAGGDLAGTNGSPQDCYFDGGVSIEEIQYKDGSGTGDPPSTDNVLRIGSNCFIKQIDATDRAGIKIQPSNAYPATLKINQMVTKTTLNKSDGTATAALFNPNQKIFATGYDVGTGITSWYSFVGFELV